MYRQGHTRDFVSYSQWTSDKYKNDKNATLVFWETPLLILQIWKSSRHSNVDK